MPLRRPLLLRTTAALSLTLLLALIPLWLRSYTTADFLYYGAPTAEQGLISTAGHLLLYREHAIPPFQWPPPQGLHHGTSPAKPRVVDYTPANTTAYIDLFGLGHYAGDNDDTIQQAFFIHHAYLAALLLIQPLRYLRHGAHPRNRLSLLCPHCGYDLRATPLRCPECGRTP